MQLIGLILEIILMAAMLILTAGGFLIAEAEKISKKIYRLENPLHFGRNAPGKNT